MEQTLKRLSSGGFPKTFDKSNESEFDQTLREAKNTISETMWYWDLLIWMIADTASEMLKLENVAFPDLARIRIFKLYNS